MNEGGQVPKLTTEKNASVCSQLDIEENHIADHLPVGKVELSAAATAAATATAAAAANFFLSFPSDVSHPRNLLFVNP